HRELGQGAQARQTRAAGRGRGFPRCPCAAGDDTVSRPGPADGEGESVTISSQPASPRARASGRHRRKNPMARGINKVILVGNLGNDPETKYTQAGMAITRVSLATTSVRKDRDGNQQERTEWHRVVFFGKLGEIAGEYLRKG